MAKASAKKSRSRSNAPHPGAVRVVCVDDHAVLIEGLKAQFELDRDIVCIGHLSSAVGLLDELDRVTPDVILLDIEMPGPDVFEVAERVRRAHPEIRFAFLSAHVRDGYLAAAYKCGASGYFAKGDDLEAITAGVKKIASSSDGTFIMGPKVRERCQTTTQRRGRVTTRSKPTNQPPVTTLQSLTARELEVLRLIGKGYARGDIARELSRSAKTIDGHQERLMKKLGVDSRAELMRFAIREGLAEA